MNVNTYTIKYYENKYNWTLGQNKPNSNPIFTPLFRVLYTLRGLVRRRRIQMNVRFLYTKDYENICDRTLGENKPNLVRRRRIENEPNTPLHKHCDLLHLKGCLIMWHLSRYWLTKWNYQINSLRKVVQKC